MPISVAAIMPSVINTPLYEQGLTKLGVLPNAIPPVYEADAVADAILHAAANPVGDIVVGASGEALLLGQRLSPSLVDALMRRLAFDIQYTDRPKSADAPTHVFAPIDGYNRVQGAFSAQQQPANLFIRGEREPLAEATADLAASAAGVVAGAVGLLSALFGRRSRA